MSLGNALVRLGERERSTARLEDAIAAYSEALQEIARERAPIQWATATGSQGAALMQLGQLRGKAMTAKLAVQKVEAAVAAFQENRNSHSAAFYEARLAKARALAGMSPGPGLP